MGISQFKIIAGVVLPLQGDKNEYKCIINKDMASLHLLISL